MAPTLSSTSFKRDVRAPVLSRLHKGTSLRGLRVILLFALDAMMLSLAWKLAEMFGTPWSSLWNLQDNPAALFPVLAIELSVLLAAGLYKSGEPRRNYLGLVKAITLAVILLLLVAYFYQPTQFVSRSRFLLFWLFSTSFIVSERFVVDRLIATLRVKGAIRYPVFLIADSDNLEHAMQLIHNENRYEIVGVSKPDALNEVERTRTFDKIRQLGVAEMFVSWEAIRDRLFLCWQFQAAGISVHVVPVELEALFHSSKFWTMRNFPVVSFSPPTMTGSDFWIKRVVDFCLALILLALFAPIYGLIALLIKLDSPGPIFYRQNRVGLHGACFKAWKFRTMVVNADQLQKQLEAQNEMKDGVLFKLKDDPRVTRVGQFLRQYSLDELPQLFNVLLGEMSLVGPRPLPVRDVNNFADHHYVRHEVLPGITGLWQVSGRSDISNFEEVIQLDLAYIQNWSLGLDLKILLKTVKVVLNKTGAY
jgi:exopolysaccharide biosynthesis polyprenyl glycosylphosphotransferase